MKYLILLILLFNYATPTRAQMNLVPNPSFEDTLNCNNFWGYLMGSPWFTPTNCTPDYYYGLSPTCAFGSSAVQNAAGFQLPLDGIAYVGLYLAMPVISFIGTRDYICAQLSDSLIATKEYYLEFHVSRANKYYLATDDIGAYVSSQIPINTGCSYLPYQPQVENLQGNIITDSLNWTKISGVFTAQGGEKYITIGNFKDSLNTTIIDADNGNGEYNNSYYYIDKVSLIPMDSLQVLNSLFGKEELFEVSPSIVKCGSSFLIYSKIFHDCTFDLFLTDGRKIKSGIIHPENNYLASEGLNPGIYILSIVDEKVRLSKKIVVY